MEKSPATIAAKEMSLKRKTFIEVSIVNINPKDETKAEKTEILDGEQNKKIIKLSELMSNMDPLEYFSRFLGTPEMIFRHFKGKDLIKISEVSPSYYNFIASSKLFMENIEVSFGRNRTIEQTEDLIREPESYPLYTIAPSKDIMEFKVGFHDECDPEDYNLLKNSSRLYQNIKIQQSAAYIKDRNGNYRKVGDYMNNSELDLFHSKVREWKSVTLYHVYFRKKVDLWRLLSAIESSVESLCVADYGSLSFEDPFTENESFEEFKFPKLKKLIMAFTKKSSFVDIWVKFFLNSVTIEELIFRDQTEKVGKDNLTKMLENSDKLTSLFIDSFISDQLFEDESWKLFKFKLKSLNIGVYYYTDFGINYRNFLKSQSDYLENLTTEIHLENRETFDVVMKMPKLKYLGILYAEAFPENENPNKISTSITELKTLKYVNPGSLKFLLDSMPKVTSLKLRSFDEEGLKMLKSMKRKFEKLKVRESKGVYRKEMEEIMIENYTSLDIIEII